MDDRRTREPRSRGVPVALPAALLGMAALVAGGLLISGCEELLGARPVDTYRERAFLPAGLPGIALHVQLVQRRGGLEARIGVENRGTTTAELTYGVCSIDFVVTPPRDPSAEPVRLLPDPPWGCPDVGLMTRITPGELVWPNRLEGAVSTGNAPTGEYVLTLGVDLWPDDSPGLPPAHELEMGRIRLP